MTPQESLNLEIIIPFFNASNTIHRTLQSIKNQKFYVKRILIINDGSNELEKFKLKSIVEKFNLPIEVFSQENGGVSKARNKGVEMAQTETHWICFIDSDDYYADEFLDVFNEALREFPKLDVFCGSLAKIRGKEKLLKEYRFKDCLLTGDEAVIELLSAKKINGLTQNKIYRKSILENILFDTDININEDILFNLEIFSRASLIKVSSKIIFYYRMHELSMMNSFTTKKADVILSASKKIKSFCVDKNLASNYYLEYYAIHVILGIIKISKNSIIDLISSMKYVLNMCEIPNLSIILKMNVPFSKKLPLILIKIFHYAKSNILRYQPN